MTVHKAAIGTPRDTHQFVVEEVQQLRAALLGPGADKRVRMRK
jgi:hypothetical protein